MKKVDIEPFKSSKVKLPDFRSGQERAIATQRRFVAQKRATLDELERNIGETRALVQQIKGLGHRFCEMNPGSKDCPLCAAHYEFEGLLSRIGSLEVGSVDSHLRELTAELAREEAKLTNLQHLSMSLERLGEAASLVLPPKQMISSLGSITAALSSLGTERSQEQTTLEDLTAKQSRLGLQGFSEVELDQLLSRAKVIFGSSVSSASAVRRAVADRDKRVAVRRKDLADSAELEAETRRQARQLHRECLGVDDLLEPSIELERNLAAVEQALALVAYAARNISLRVTDDFAEVKTQLATFSASLGRVQLALKHLEEKDVFEKRLRASLKENEKDVANLEPRQARAKQALELIHGLLKSENKEQYLKEIVGNHLQRLSTVFCRIHAPNEFEEVQLDGVLSLKRSVGDDANVYEISTGQRSALALSIFLTMNSSVSTRAPWLIFDEPVAHVDDLNILSFFDVLRDLVLLGNRQVFFATANSRIADLFVRKFDFLGPASLKEFRLGRAN